MGTKTAALIASLTARESKHFGRYLAANENQSLSKAFEFFRNQQKNGTVERGLLFAHLFPGKKFNDLKVRHLLSDLTKALESYIAYLEYQNSPALQEVHLMRALRHRNLEQQFTARMKTVEKRRLNGSHSIDPDHFLGRYLFHREILLFNEQMSRKEDMNLEALATCLDDFYIVSKLKTACNMRIHEGLVQKKYDDQLIREVIDFIERENYLDHDLIAVYYHYYKALTEEDNDSHYAVIRSILERNDHGLKQTEQRDVYLLLINFCIRKFNKGQSAYIHELFSVYKEALENGALYTRNKLTHFTFKNIVSAGLYVREFEWTKAFIEEYRNRLDDVHRDSIVALSLAKLQYGSGEYDRVLETLRTAKIKDQYLKISGKIMAIRALYDGGQYDLALSHVENFQLFLRREKMMSYHKSNYTNYAKCMKLILQTNAYDKVAVRKLREQIAGIEILSEKKWLLERADRLASFG